MKVITTDIIIENVLKHFAYYSHISSTYMGSSYDKIYQKLVANLPLDKKKIEKIAPSWGKNVCCECNKDVEFTMEFNKTTILCLSCLETATINLEKEINNKSIKS